jgi:hypothetical protein
MGKKVVALVMALALAAAASGASGAERVPAGKLVDAVGMLVKGASGPAATGVELLADFQGAADAALFSKADIASAALRDAMAAVQRIDASARPELAAASLAYLNAAQDLVKSLQDARHKAARVDALDREATQVATDLKEAKDSDRPQLLEHMEKVFGQSDDAEAAMKESVTRASAALAGLELRRALLAAQLGPSDALLPEKTLAVVRRGLQAVQPAEQ